MIGETLGRRYKLLRLVGRGGMGSVYEAEHNETGERVAVKVLHGHLLLSGGDGPRRFRREAEAVLSIESEHIVRMIDAGTDEDAGHLYLVTEYLEGEDLQKVLDRAGVLSEKGALAIAEQALVGLRDAHAAGVIHRDIKPANILLSRRADGTLAVKILDFGIAKLKPDPLGSKETTNLTATGTFLGSPLYMSPEQVQNSRDVDARSDLWSLGCVLYACLAGRAPHQHLTSLGQLLVAICTAPAPALSDVAPWLPREVTGVVQRALELSPDSRYPSAAAMIEALRELGPAPPLVEEMLASSRPSPRTFRDSSIPPSPGIVSPRVVVASDPVRAIRGDDTTQLAAGSPPPLARSGVPTVGARSGARQVTVDPRRILGEKSELWTFSLDVHRHLGSLLARIWKALRRGGADLPSMTYGKAWVLFEPRTGRTIEDAPEGEERLSLEAAGIRPGTVLWVVRPDTTVMS